LLFDHSLYASASIKFNDLLLAQFTNNCTIHRSGGTLLKTSQRLLSAFPFVTVVITVYKNKALLLMSSYCGLTTSEKYRGLPEALAGKAAEHSRLPLLFAPLLCQDKSGNKNRKFNQFPTL
jgi:hypothetical protein